MKYKELSFHDLYHKPCIVTHKIDALGLEEDEVDVPKHANAVLAYPYIDRQIGFTFEILAPAVFPDGTVLEDYALLDHFNIFSKLRSDLFTDFDILLLSDPDEYKAKFEKHCKIIDEGYSAGEEVEATRKITVIDHLRNEDHPDDVFTVLLSKEKLSEGVWVRLEAITGEGELCGTLLNEPYSDFDVHAGDIVTLGLKSQREGGLALFTTDQMLLERKSQDRSILSLDD
ncbi:MAG: hypothetical protein HGA54_07505 [Actinobacteria bacterium]|nr:hypothetical protein [Actinomycetota bacterium]